MLPRIIPALLLDRSKRLVKTLNFKDEVYVGDPYNVIRLFNEKEVDEICVLDIDATTNQRPPDVEFISSFASECFMPLAYGGGITQLSEVEALFKAGVEKVVIGSSAINQDFLRDIVTHFGSQSLVISIDVSSGSKGWEVYINRGKKIISSDPVAYAQGIVEAGAGEILLNNIDRDGTRIGYDTQLIRQITEAVPIPVIALGGAGEKHHLNEGFSAGASAVASGSAFVFIGPLRAVLITYPTAEELQETIHLDQIYLND